MGAALALGGLALGAGAAARARPSLPMRGAKVFLRLTRRRGADLTEVERAYRTRAAPTAAPIPARLEAACTVERRAVRGRPVIRLTPRRGASGLHVVYTHGGGYVNALVGNHWDLLGMLVRHTGATVTVPLYPLAPESTWRAAFAMLEDVYREVLAGTPADRVVLCGDSAGGALALAQAMRYRDAGLPLPGRVVLFAPWLDLTLADPQIREVERRDVMLGVEKLRLLGGWWAGGENPRTPSLSPLHGDPRGLPPIDLYQGTDDLLAVDGRTFARRARGAGADVRLHETPGGFHVFMAVPWIPEAREVHRRVAAALRRPSAGA